MLEAEQATILRWMAMKSGDLPEANAGKIQPG